MDNLLILVDENDNETGYGEKLETHVNGQLHRAFSVFVFDWSDSTMLIQRRAFEKYHSGGLWSNACCSHPKKGETMAQAVSNRLKDELGLHCNCRIENAADSMSLRHGTDVIYYCGKFKYFARFDGLSEHEIDNVFLYSPDHDGFSKTDFTINPDEIADIRWVKLNELQRWLDNNPEDFSAWFKSAYELVYPVLCRQAREKNEFLIS